MEVRGKCAGYTAKMVDTLQMQSVCLGCCLCFQLRNIGQANLPCDRANAFLLFDLKPLGNAVYMLWCGPWPQTSPGHVIHCQLLLHTELILCYHLYKSFVSVESKKAIYSMVNGRGVAIYVNLCLLSSILCLSPPWILHWWWFEYSPALLKNIKFQCLWTQILCPALCN